MKIRFRNSFITLLIPILFPLLANGQYYSSGQDPASTKWEQINTSYFQIIFPENYEKQAQYLANILDSAYSLARVTLKVNIKKTSIILHNQTVTSNGTTAWAPTRVDLYTTPPQQTYAQKWLDQLALHETRHLIQIEKLNTGLTNVLKTILGEQALAFIAGIFIPQWFLEGDAVVTETALSEAGRGREPNFKMPVKAQLLEKGIYSYEKSVHGSFKDFVPGPYETGFLMVAWGRNNFASGLWENSLVNAARNPFLITPFSKAIKKTTGFSKQGFYRSAMNDLKLRWDTNLHTQKFIPFQQLTSQPKYYTNYYHPLLVPDKGILAFKSSLDDIQRFVLISPSGKEKKILSPGPNLNDRISYAKGLLCWSEVEFDVRWQNRNFSVIKTYKLGTKKLKQLTTKSRFFSPSLSHDAKKIVAIEVSTSDEYSVVILDSQDGNIIKRYFQPDHDFLMGSSWSEDDNEIVFISLNQKGKSIQVLNLASGKFEKQFDESFVEISNPRITKNFIYFTGAFSGTDNIYAFNRTDKNISQITAVKYGADNVFVDEKNGAMLFSNYTSSGYEIAKQQLSANSWIPLEHVHDHSVDFVSGLLKQEKGILTVDHQKDKNFEVKKYPKASGLINIHSWAPASLNVNTYEVSPGFSLMSQNKLSTAFATMGYEYNPNESLGKYYFNYTYEGFYPTIDFNLEYGKRRHIYSDSLGNIQTFYYHETDVETEVALPLTFSKGIYSRGFQPSVKLKNSFLKKLPGSQLHFSQNSAHSLLYRLYFYNTRRMSARDLYPLWGQIFDIRFGNTPFQTEKKSWITGISSAIYFPGFFKHHGIKLFNGYQKRQEGVYYFPQIVNYPRGYLNRNDTELFRTSINYKFPLCYPDFNIGSLLYVKRLKLALYYDQAWGKNANEKTTYRTTGFELSSDLYFLSLLAPFDMGFRYIYYPDKKTNAFEFLISVDFSALY